MEDDKRQNGLICGEVQTTRTNEEKVRKRNESKKRRREMETERICCAI
jgi:hypothetical protein